MHSWTVEIELRKSFLRISRKKDFIINKLSPFHQKERKKEKQVVHYRTWGLPHVPAEVEAVGDG